MTSDQERAYMIAKEILNKHRAIPQRPSASIGLASRARRLEGEIAAAGVDLAAAVLGAGADWTPKDACEKARLAHYVHEEATVRLVGGKTELVPHLSDDELAELHRDARKILDAVEAERTARQM